MATLTDINGVSDSRAGHLRDEGFNSVDKVANADPSDLTDVHGVGEASAQDLVENAKEALKEDHIDSGDGDETEEPDLEELEEVDHGSSDGEEDDGDGDESENEEESREDVDEDDVEELVEEAQESDEEPEVDEGEDEEPDGSEEETPDVLTVSVEVETNSQFDYFFDALIQSYFGAQTVGEEETFERAIDNLRDIGGTGKFEIEVSQSEMNTIHASVKDAELSHQTNRRTEAFEAVREIKEEVNNERSRFF